MSIVGRVQAIWRYPVKSMRGEELTEATLGALGIPGDRGWAVRDETAGEFRGAKQFPVLMQCRARYRVEPSETEIPQVDLELAGHPSTASDAPDVNERLSALIGKPVSLWSRRPAGDREHYRRRAKRTIEETREILGLKPEEPLPDLSAYPAALMAELREFTSPLGTYFDAFPLHFITTSWLDTLRQARPGSRFDAPRFRPNVLIDRAAPGLPELEWCGKHLRIGAAEIACAVPTIRCSMTAQQTGDLPKDPRVLRTIVEETAQNAGAYARIVRAGSFRVGDELELL